MQIANVYTDLSVDLANSGSVGALVIAGVIIIGAILIIIACAVVGMFIYCMTWLVRTQQQITAILTQFSACTNWPNAEEPIGRFVVLSHACMHKLYANPLLSSYFIAQIC